MVICPLPALNFYQRQSAYVTVLRCIVCLQSTLALAPRSSGESGLFLSFSDLLSHALPVHLACRDTCASYGLDKCNYVHSQPY